MQKDIIENHIKYQKRVALYRTFGYNIDLERSFIIEKSLPVAGNILEAGTGKGYFTLALAQAGYKFFSLDISVAEQRFALLNLMYYGFQSQVTFLIADVESIPCNDGFFDVIFAVNMIQQDSRRYAKRQLTWFNRDKEINWFHPEDEAGVFDFLKQLKLTEHKY